MITTLRSAIRIYHQSEMCWASREDNNKEEGEEIMTQFIMHVHLHITYDAGRLDFDGSELKHDKVTKR